MKNNKLVLLTLIAIVFIFSCFTTENNGIKSHKKNLNPENEMEVGAAKIKIEFPDNFFPYTSFRERYYTGIHDDLFVRTILIKGQTGTALFISVDSGDLSDEWLAEISKLSGVPESNIYLTATHTHESPFISRTEPETTLKDVEKSQEFAKNTFAAIAQALTLSKSNLQSCQIGFGTGSCDVNINRNFRTSDNNYTIKPNPTGISDKSVPVMAFINSEEKPVAYLYNYAVHGTVMFMSKIKDEGMLISGDLPGATSRYIESVSGEQAVALWTLGCAGDQAPKFSSGYEEYDAQGNVTRKDLGENGYTLLNVQAQTLGAEVLRTVSEIKKFDNGISIQGSTKTISVKGKPESTETRNLRLGLILINDIAFVGFPGELVTSVGTTIKEKLMELGSKEAVVITQCNGSNSYFSDDFGYDNGTFDGEHSLVEKGYDKQVIRTELELFKSLSSIQQN